MTKHLQGNLWWVPTLTMAALSLLLVQHVHSLQGESDRAQQERDLLLLTFSSTSLPRMAVDEGMIIRAANESCSRLLGASVNDLVGQDAHRFIPSEYHARHDQGVENHLVEPGKIHEIDCHVKTWSGDTLPVRLYLTSMKTRGKQMFAVKLKRLKQPPKQEERK